VSATWGSGAAEVAALVAEHLGFRVIDEEILARAAAEAGVEPQVLADVEQRKSLARRLLLGLGSSADSSGLAFAGLPLVTQDFLRDDDLRGLIRAAIEEAAASGDVVIVAHAASHALGGREDVLRVLVTASPETRSLRYANEQSVYLGEAEKAIAESDAARADYFKRFYKVDAELPTHYDLVVNTDRLTPQQATELVLTAARAA
jgi:cytidylate kinase